MIRGIGIKKTRANETRELIVPAEVEHVLDGLIEESMSTIGRLY
jgi:hypothetical protein